MDRNTTIGFYFDIANQQANSVPQGKQAFLQPPEDNRHSGLNLRSCS